MRKTLRNIHRFVQKNTDRLLQKLVANRPTRLIEIDDKPYLARVYLFHRGGWRFYLHRFISADGDRFMHDHPFHGVSLVLCGAYIEERMTALSLPEPQYRLRTVRFFNWLPSKTFHRIARTMGGTWTLFINAPHHKQWGFLKPLSAEGRHGVLYVNPYDETGLGQGSHWWTTAKTFSQLNLGEHL